MDLLTALATVVVALPLGVLIGWLWARAQSSTDATARAADDALLRDGLTQLQSQLRSLEGQRIDWQAELREQVNSVRHTTEALRRETSGLATALRKPQVRGRWGELHLRRTVELAGLVDRCDFSEQASFAHDNGLHRPDLVVHLAGGKQIVVDAKVPLEAFLDATGTDEPTAYAEGIARHARQVRLHVDALGGKAYWKRVQASPEFVVLFVPGDSFLSAALEGDRHLLEYAAERGVVLATPTTLIALLRTVAVAWREQAVSDQAAEIVRTGRDLHERLGTMSAHLDRLGRALTSAVGAYNSTIGSLESRVLVSARRFEELHATTAELPSPTTVDEPTRALTTAWRG